MRTLLLSAVLCSTFAFGQQDASSSTSESVQPEKPVVRQPGETPRQEAWEILRTGATNKSTDRRVKAIGVLGLVPNNSESRALAEKATKDQEIAVRAAAATALGEMNARSARPTLRAMLDDEDPGVVLAAAKALLTMNDEAGYEAYYAVLTGQKKATGSFIDRQMKILKNPKQIAQMGIEEGLGFVPFAGMGYTAYKMLSKDEVSPVRAAAARALAKDKDPESGKALAEATSDKSWIVRKAALDALAKRGDRKLLRYAIVAMDDNKDIVMYTAAAVVVQLTERRRVTHQ